MTEPNIVYEVSGECTINRSKLVLKVYSTDYGKVLELQAMSERRHRRGPSAMVIIDLRTAEDLCDPIIVPLW